VEANEARLLSEIGEVERATQTFERAKAVTGKAADDALASGGDAGAEPSQLIMVNVLHARVLQLYASHCTKHGREVEGRAMAQQVRELEVKYGFASA